MEVHAPEISLSKRSTPLYVILGFVLDEKFQQNASKFAILLEDENPQLPELVMTYEDKPRDQKATWVFIFQKYGEF